MIRATLNGGHKKEIRAVAKERAETVMKLMDKYERRPYEDPCRGPVLAAFAEVERVFRDSVDFLNTLRQTYDQAEVARHGVLDVLGLAVPPTGINTASKISGKLDKDIVKTPNSGLSGGWVNVLYPTIDRKSAVPPPPGVAPAEMDIPYAEPGDEADP